MISRQKSDWVVWGQPVPWRTQEDGALKRVPRIAEALPFGKDIVSKYAGIGQRLARVVIENLGRYEEFAGSRARTRCSRGGRSTAKTAEVSDNLSIFTFTFQQSLRSYDHDRSEDFAMGLTRLLYFSENTMEAKTTLPSLREILLKSRRNNEAAQITGALVFDDFWFLQALEGPRAEVWRTLERIKEDDRHANVVVVDAREVESRVFGNWWMGLATRNEQNSDLFKPHLKNGMLQPADMSAGDILKLMTALCGAGFSRKLAAVA